jgi:hypothetical protein
MRILLPLLVLLACLGLFAAAKTAPAKALSDYQDRVTVRPQGGLGCGCGCIHCGC